MSSCSSGCGGCNKSCDVAVELNELAADKDCLTCKNKLFEGEIKAYNMKLYICKTCNKAYDFDTLEIVGELGIKQEKK